VTFIDIFYVVKNDLTTIISRKAHPWTSIMCRQIQQICLLRLPC